MNADISPANCGDLASDFGTECSLRELNGSNVVIDNTRFQDITAPLGDRDAGFPISRQIRVTPVGEGTSRPGLRFEVAGGAMNHDPCLLGTDSVAFNNVGYFVRANNPLLQDIEVHHVTLDGAGSARAGIGEVEFNLSENVTQQSAFSLQVPLPIEFEIPDLNVIAVEVGAATRSPGAGQPPECGSQAGVRFFEQRVELNNVPPLPPGVSDPGDIPCGILDPTGALCPAVGVTTDAGCESETAGLDIVQVVGVPAARISTCAGEVNTTSVTVPISTPLSSFEVWFDYRFQSNSQLDVYLDDALIATVPATPASTFQRQPILVNDPGLMGREQAELRFDLVGDGTAVELANLISPSFELLDARIIVQGLASITSLETLDLGTGQQTGDVNRESYENRCNLIEDVLEGPKVECTDSESSPVLTFGSGIFLGDQTNIVESPIVGSSSTCQTDSRGFAVLGGVGTGLFSSSTRDLSASEPVDTLPRETQLDCNPSARSGAAYVVRDTSGLLPPGTLVPIRYKLRSHGTVVFDAAAPIAIAGGGPFAELSVTGQIGMDRAFRGLEVNAVFEGRTFFVFEAEGPFFEHDTDLGPGYWQGSNCPDGEDPNDPPMGTPSVSGVVEYFGDTEDISSVTFILDHAYCVPEVFYARIDQVVVVDLNSELDVSHFNEFGTNPFDGAVVADFTDTFDGTLSTTVPGVEFVPVEIAALLDFIYRNGFEGE